jgi:hypothetical protein
MITKTKLRKRITSEIPNFETLPALIYIRGKPAYIIPTPGGNIGARLGSVQEVEGPKRT